MIISCISHPPKHPLSKNSLIIHEWQIIACKGDFKAAALLSYLELKHNTKIDIDGYHKDTNDEAEQQGLGRIQNEDTLIRVKLADLREDLYAIGVEKTLSHALDFLADELGFISLHANPNPEKILDRTKYVRFYPEICNAWIRAHYRTDGTYIEQSQSENEYIPTRNGKKSLSKMTNVSIDSDKSHSREGKKSLSENSDGSFSDEPAQLIDSYQNEVMPDRFGKMSESLYINNQYQSNQLINSINQSENENIKAVLNALVAKGITPEKFNYADAKLTIERLIEEGATIEIFTQAYDVSAHATQGKGFGVNYLARVVETLLKKSKKPVVDHKANHRTNTVSQANRRATEYVYKHDLKNAESWASDLI